MEDVVLYLAILGFVILATSAFAHRVPRFAQAVLAGESGRNHALDGLRGVLAFSVMIHHTMLGFALHNNASPAMLAAYPFVNHLGQMSVALFFMITACLFGSRLLRDGGRLALVDFFFGRFMRIVPLYLFAVGLVTFLSFAAQGFVLVQPARLVMHDIARNLLFDFVPRGGIDGFMTARDILGPVWTLHYEWLFYFCLPVMAWLYRLTGRAIPLYMLLVGIGHFYNPLFYFFATGLASAQLATLDSPQARRAWPVAGVVSLVIAMSGLYQSLSWFRPLMLIPTLVAVLQGHRWFTLLGSRPLRCLGAMSFSIYLLHPVVIYLVLSSTGLSLSQLGTGSFVVVDIAIGLLIIALSTLTYLLVEKPTMHAHPVKFRRLAA